MRSQERAPGRRRRRRAPAEILGDGGFGDLNAQLLEFAVNVGRTPQGIGAMHLLDQCSDVGCDGRATETRARRTPSPLLGEQAAMPRDDRGGLHDLQGVAPPAPHTREEHP